MPYIVISYHIRQRRNSTSSRRSRRGEGRVDYMDDIARRNREDEKRRKGEEKEKQQKRKERAKSKKDKKPQKLKSRSGKSLYDDTDITEENKFDVFATMELTEDHYAAMV